ncbi:uncharacterized protein LOC117110526 [Anneissia japonica]|uniref:uncharacterized protein LOC117110526 n=1 Tax=Anneissia japonica TaxID=1529436 RepID=UPI0014255A30|nr:uncharacterized protein LOC117110526 [Anneissia japonica]
MIRRRTGDCTNMLGLRFFRALSRKFLIIKSVKTYLLVLTIILFGIYKLSFKTILTTSRNGERQIYSTPIGLRHAENKSIMIEALTHEFVDLSELLELLLKPWAKNQSNLVDLRKKMYGKKYNDANLTEVMFASQSSMKPGEKYRQVFFYPRAKGRITNGIHKQLPKVNAHFSYCVTFYSTMNTLSFDTIISVLTASMAFLVGSFSLSRMLEAGGDLEILSRLIDLFTLRIAFTRFLKLLIESTNFVSSDDMTINPASLRYFCSSRRQFPLSNLQLKSPAINTVGMPGDLNISASMISAKIEFTGIPGGKNTPSNKLKMAS